MKPKKTKPKTTLTLQEILFGKAGRRRPDAIDLMYLRAMDEINEENGGQGATEVEVAERLLGRELTDEELAFANTAEKAVRAELEEAKQCVWEFCAARGKISFTSPAPHVTEAEIQAAIEDTAQMENLAVRTAMLDLIKEGRIVEAAG